MTKLDLFIDKLYNALIGRKIDSNSAKKLLATLFMHGDKILSEMWKSSLLYPLRYSYDDLCLVQIVGECLQIIPEEKRPNILHDISKYESLTLLCEVFNLYINLNNEGFKLINDDNEVKVIRKEIIELIESNTELLIDTPRLAYVIKFWEDSSNLEKVQKWIGKAVIPIDINFLKFVLSFIIHVRTSNNDNTTTVRLEIYQQSLSRYKLQDIRQRLNQITKTIPQHSVWMLDIITMALANTKFL